MVARSPSTNWLTCSARSEGSAWSGASSARAAMGPALTGRSPAGHRRSAGFLGLAFPAEGDAAEGADQADERPAAGAGIALGRPLLSTAGAARHRVVLVDLGHRRSRREVVPLDLVDQGRTRNPELDRRPGPVAGVVLEGSLDVLPLEVFEAQRRVAAVPDAGAGAKLAGQVLDAHGGLPPAQDQGALEDVAHLPYVARPGVGQQPLQHFGRY